jgi:hypothetical protein
MWKCETDLGSDTLVIKGEANGRSSLGRHDVTQKEGRSSQDDFSLAEHNLLGRTPMRLDASVEERDVNVCPILP